MREICRDCGRVTLNPYWFSAKGAKLKQPRCPECHERTIWSGAAGRAAGAKWTGWQDLRGRRWKELEDG